MPQSVVERIEQATNGERPDLGIQCNRSYHMKAHSNCQSGGLVAKNYTSPSLRPAATTKMVVRSELPVPHPGISQLVTNHRRRQGHIRRGRFTDEVQDFAPFGYETSHHLRYAADVHSKMKILRES